MKHLLNYMGFYKKECIIAPLFKMLEAMFDLLVPLVIARMINTGIVNRDSSLIVKCTALLIGMAIVGLLCSFIAQYFAARAATGVATRIRHDLFAHIQSLGASELDTVGTSTLITRMTSDVNQVQNGLNLFLRLFLRSPFIVFGAMVMAFTIEFRAAMIFVLTVPVLSVIVFGIMKWTSPRYRQIQSRLDNVTRATRENLNGVRVVRAFGREESETAQFVDANAALVALQNKVGKISGLMNPMTYIVVNLGIVAILFSGAKSVEGGILLSGNVIALVNYMSQILVELVKLANLIVQLSRAGASMDRVSVVLDTEPSMTYPGTITAAHTNEAVRFQDVSLTYRGAGEESLSHISFCALDGETVGVIGGTGSGKTSLVSLIARLYDATAGTVSLGGAPISQWEKNALRKHVAIVMQKAQLFQGTVRSNLLWGNENATDSELWEALEAAQAAEFVRSKPKGLDEPVEQGGRNLSGGQKQRLTVARALVRKPKILILDDSASALDFATDAALRKALRNLPWKSTVFIVSQRTSSLRHADTILVLEDGCLIGSGTHEMLLDSCTAYREIHESQFKKEGQK